MGAKMFGARKSRAADNDNTKPKVDKNGEIPLDFEDRRTAPLIEARPGSGWYCLVTVPQNEFRCADALSEEGVATYVPTRTFWEKRRRGKDLYNTELQAPLFRGYVFAQLSRPFTTEAGAPALGRDWGPIFARDAWGHSRIGALHFLGTHGMPAAMPLSYKNADGALCGIGPLADDERAGWFDDRKRDFLIALQEQRKAQEAEAARKAEEDAAAAEKAERRARKPVWVGDVVRPLTGPFQGQQYTAENDNDDKGLVRLSASMFGQVVITMMPVGQLENLTRPYATPHAGNVSGLRRA